MRPVKLGMIHKEQVVAGTQHLASAVGNRGVHVVSSPATILFIEMACHRAIECYLDPGEATVGVKFDLAHRAAARPGEPLNVTVELVQRDERNRLSFRAEVVQDGKTIMDGEHHRAIVELARLLRTDNSQCAPQWSLWFDFQSPWICLFLARAQELAANCGAQIQYFPISLNASPALDSPERVAWVRQDLLDHIEHADIPVVLEPCFPASSAVPLAACVYAERQGVGGQFVSAMARACWVENRNIGDLKTIASIATHCQLDAVKVTRALEQGLLDDLRTNTGNALKSGLFETPTIQYSGKLYCGYHRLEMLVRHTLAAQTGAMKK